MAIYKKGPDAFDELIVVQILAKNAIGAGLRCRCNDEGVPEAKTRSLLNFRSKMVSLRIV